MASSDPDEFVYRRSFAAPREQVYRAFTEASQLAQWWGPQGCTIEVVQHEAGAGGRFHYVMHFGAALNMGGGAMAWHGLFEYRELTPPGRIVFVNGFADENGQRIRHPLMPTWPIEMLITVELEDAGGETRMTLRMAPLNASELERETFRTGHPSMQQGFAGTFDKLDAYLSESKH
jgi:uncharacterized protein YndB with AHSA1/START domain